MKKPSPLKLVIGNGMRRFIICRVEPQHSGDGTIAIFTPDGEGGHFNEDEFSDAVANFVAPRL